MNNFEQQISVHRHRDEFQTNSKSSSSTSCVEAVASDISIEDIGKQNSYTHIPCPPLLEKPTQKRPFHGKVKTDQCCSDAEIATQCFCAAERSKCNDFRSPHQTSAFSFEPYNESNTREIVGKESTTYEIYDANMEKRRKKRNEKKERVSKRREIEKKGKEDKLEAERNMADLSRNRSIFNGHKDTLPSIGKTEVEVGFYLGKLPDEEEPDILKKSEPDNNVIDVIRKHNAQVRTTAILKDIGHEYLNVRSRLLASHSQSEAVNIIEKHEEENGKAYHVFKECQTAASFMYKNARQQASLRSKRSSSES